MNGRKKIYFLGISKIKSDSEKFFDEISGKLVPNYERYYITKDKEIGESRKDIDGKCLVSMLESMPFLTKVQFLFLKPLSGAKIFLCPGWKDM